MVDPEAARSLRTLLQTQPVAALGTLHRGDPAVSMVPFVLPAGEMRVFIHVSALATHTADMQRHPRVSLLVMAEPCAAASLQALPRVSLQTVSQTLPRDEVDYAAARAADLDRFPDAAETFEWGDFSIVTTEPCVSVFGAIALLGFSIRAIFSAEAARKVSELPPLLTVRSVVTELGNLTALTQLPRLREALLSFREPSLIFVASGSQATRAQ